MNSFEFLEKLGFSSNEAKVYGTLIKHKVLNGYEIAKLSGVARSLVYEVINRLIAKGAVIRIDGEPNFYKPIEYQDLIRSIKEENEKNIACAERELQQLATENADVDYVMNIVGEEKYIAKAKELIDSAQAEISLSIWQESFEVLRSNIENAISRGVKVYIFTFESISVAGATVYSYNINDVSTVPKGKKLAEKTDTDSQNTYRSKSYKQVRNKYQRHIFFTRNQCKYFHYNSPLHIENIYLYNDNRFLPFRIDFFMFIG